jgi:hypothetical protein
MLLSGALSLAQGIRPLSGAQEKRDLTAQTSKLIESYSEAVPGWALPEVKSLDDAVSTMWLIGTRLALIEFELRLALFEIEQALDDQANLERDELQGLLDRSRRLLAASRVLSNLVKPSLALAAELEPFVADKASWRGLWYPLERFVPRPV